MKKNARIKINNNNHNSNKKEKINIKQIRNCFSSFHIYAAEKNGLIIYFCSF
jgi:hypothetical protein